MIEIIPAVIAKNWTDLNESLARYVSLAPIVQIDICDGKFVPSSSWPMQMSDKSEIADILNEEAGLPFWDKMDFEFDLMVLNAHKQFEFFTSLGAKRIIFHLEAEEEKSFKEFLEAMDLYIKENISIGIAINTDTDISKLSPFINHIDFVQVMGIEHIGFQGEPFDEKALTKIKELKDEYPELTISVDGSVNENTAPALVKAGADRLVIGSALINSYDVRETIHEFSQIGL